MLILPAKDNDLANLKEISCQNGQATAASKAD
jgi:hypothetical protein